MLIIEHRINTVAQLKNVPAAHGVEIDLRECGDQICLTHEPFTGGERLVDFLDAYAHRTIIFNVKCDGLEGRIASLAAQRKITDYFFLDCALPTAVKLARAQEKRQAIRFSEFEPLELALRFAGLAEWVWVDCFTKFPLDQRSYEQLKRHFRLCLVSPELQGHPLPKIDEYRALLAKMPFDAVCTDFPEKWS